MIEIKDLSFQYRDSDALALKDINLTIEDGDFMGIIGGSGAGKSTLTYALNGIVPHHKRGDFYGSVKICGLDTVDARPENISAHVGSVFQDIDGQMVSSVVEDEILFGLENFGFSRQEIGARMAEAMDLLAIADLRYRSINSLSGGQKQKVAIASIIALRPQILVLDEPTGELDPQSSMQIFSHLKTLNEKYHITIVVVEQKTSLLAAFARRIIVMEKGSVYLDGTVREVMGHGDALSAIGVEIPSFALLSEKLRAEGLYRGPTLLTLSEAKTMVEEVLYNDSI